MAGPYMGGYTPPGSYGNYGPGYGQQMYSSPVAQQLTRMENQYPQYGQTMQPQYQQGQPNGQPMQNMQQQQSQQNQSNPGPMLFMLSSIDQMSMYPKDTDGNMQVFLVDGDDRLYTRQIDIGSGKTLFYPYQRMYSQEEQEGQQEPKEDKATQDTKEGEKADHGQILAVLDEFKEEIKSTLSDFRNELDELKGAIDDVKSNIPDDDSVKPTSATNGADGTGNGKPGSKAGRNNRPNDSDEPATGKQQNADGAEGKKS